MDNGVFRKKSMERISSPEQLNDYIRVSNPGIWLLLAAIAILLAGACVWAIFGTIESSITVCAVSDGEETLCYIREADKDECAEGLSVVINGETYTLGALSSEPEKADEKFTEYGRHIGGFSIGEWLYSAKVGAALPEGTYSAKIIIEQIKPMSFVFN